VNSLMILTRSSAAWIFALASSLGRSRAVLPVSGTDAMNASVSPSASGLSSVQPAAALELDGIVTDVERLKARRNDEPGQPAPMFIFSKDVQGFGPTIRKDDDSPAMRNVTPEAASPGPSQQE
jgi:hypothetical protein